MSYAEERLGVIEEYLISTRLEKDGICYLSSAYLKKIKYLEVEKDIRVFVIKN